jgi:hypothetical protein
MANNKLEEILRKSAEDNALRAATAKAAAPEKPEMEKPRLRVDPRAEERRKRYLDGRRNGRNDLARRQKLSVHDYGGQLDGHHWCWVNDYPGQVESFIQKGYSPVLNNAQIKVGDQTEDFSLKTDRWVSASVGKLDDNSAQRAFLLKIPDEWYREDRAAEMTIRINKEKQIYGEDFKKNPNVSIGNDASGEFYLNREQGVYIKRDATRKWQENSL